MNTNPPPSDRFTTNYAASGSTVGMQADEIHHATVYQVLPDDPPQKKYGVGVRYLDSGVPSEAEKLISAAIADGYDNEEVRFHWVLAMLSKRSYRDLTPSQRDRLQKFATQTRSYPDNPYTAALDVITELLVRMKSGNGNTASAEERIPQLRRDLREKIDLHLNLLISGAIRDRLWTDTKERAKADRYAHDRAGRAWAYFHPEPIDARAQEPNAECVTTTDRYRAIAATMLFTLAAGYLGWLIMSAFDVVAILAYLGAVAAGYIAVHAAFEWRYRRRRYREELTKHFGYSNEHARGKGFANQVSRSFEWYFGKYRPPEFASDRQLWLDEVAGIRNYLRIEISHLYREQRTPVGQVNWLIGYLAQDVRRRWKAGTLYEYQTLHQVNPLTQIRCVAAAAGMLVGTAIVVLAALPVAPFYASLAVLVAAISGGYAARQWEHIVSEKHRYLEEYAGYEDRLDQRRTAHRQWKAKLDRLRPSETQMETWLNCDKIAFIAEALRHYRLSWSDLISHAMFQSPGHPVKGRKRRRDRHGPWRYNRYGLWLFLITEDGVREVSSTLNFVPSTFAGKQRHNFRFDAVSSLNVEDAPNARILELTLTNGPARPITVTEPEPRDAELAGASTALLDMNLDTAGFTHTLHILEGIAAEGRAWFDHDKLTSA